MVNYFAVFGLNTGFDIDIDVLEKKYFEFQAQLHPDKAGVEEIEKSIKINEGYKVLVDDFLRCCHLLALQGFDILQDEKAIKVDQKILLEILELQEQIADNKDLKKLDEWQSWLNQNIKNLINLAKKNIDDKEMANAAQILVKAKYYKKCLADIKNKKKSLKNAT